MNCPNTIAELVERFERNIESYKAGTYNETRIRREFLDSNIYAYKCSVPEKEIQIHYIEISSHEADLHQLIYQLYNPTEEEIKIVEGE